MAFQVSYLKESREVWVRWDIRWSGTNAAMWAGRGGCCPAGSCAWGIKEKGRESKSPHVLGASHLREAAGLHPGCENEVCRGDSKGSASALVRHPHPVLLPP